MAITLVRLNTVPVKRCGRSCTGKYGCIDHRVTGSPCDLSAVICGDDITCGILAGCRSGIGGHSGIAHCQLIAVHLIRRCIFPSDIRKRQSPAILLHAFRNKSGICVGEVGIGAGRRYIIASALIACRFHLDAGMIQGKDTGIPIFGRHLQFR